MKYCLVKGTNGLNEEVGQVQDSNGRGVYLHPHRGVELSTLWSPFDEAEREFGRVVEHHTKTKQRLEEERLRAKITNLKVIQEV